MNADALLFFDRAPAALPLYALLEERVLAMHPACRAVVQRSQIAFDCGRRFAFASLRGKRLVVSFGLPVRIDSPRIRQAVEPYPGRWTHHVLLEDPAQLDDELLGWIAQACAFAARQ